MLCYVMEPLSSNPFFSPYHLVVMGKFIFDFSPIPSPSSTIWSPIYLAYCLCLQDVVEDDIPCSGITEITETDFEYVGARVRVRARVRLLG